jgi:Cu-Zn family superoxide dismutase
MYTRFSTRSMALKGLLVLTFSALGTGCPKPPPPDPDPNQPAVTMATAAIEARSSSAVSGTATFEQVGNKVKIVVEVSGATPGQHGLHIHEKGDCSAPDAKSAGDHFNPGKMEHGSPDKPMRHAGDFGNITVADDGKGRLELESDQLSVSAGANGALGRAIVLHEKPDDTVTQPSGNSGARIGCGAIAPKQ